MNIHEANLHQNFLEMKKEAEQSILERRPDSKSWILMMNIAPVLLGARRGRLLQIVNAGMRRLDDIADGDRQPPEGFTPREYILAKKALVEDPTNAPENQDDLDMLFLYGLSIAQSLNLEGEVQASLLPFFPYFEFDEGRRNTGEPFPQAELDYAYDQCDIEGTVRGSLIIFGDNPEKTPLLIPLARAVRKYYTLRDFQEDIDAGLVNISIEAIRTHGISESDLGNSNSSSLRAWFEREAKDGLELLALHHEIMAVEDFRGLGKFALTRAYERKAEKYFHEVFGINQ